MATTARVGKLDTSVNGPHGDDLGWDLQWDEVPWHSVEDDVRRLRQRIHIRVDDEINALLVRIALLGISAQRLDHLSQGKAVVRDLIDADTFELGVDGLTPAAGVNDVRSGVRIGNWQ